jgi:hypothetical protein
MSGTCTKFEEVEGAQVPTWRWSWGRFSATITQEGDSWRWQLRDSGHADAHGDAYDFDDAVRWAVMGLRSRFNLRMRKAKTVKLGYFAR